MPSTRSAAARDALRRPFLCAVLLACALVLSISDGADPDLWGHVRYGADVLRSGAIPATTTYAYTVPGYPWIDHELGSELVFAVLAQAGGGTALTAFKMLLGLALLGLLMAMAARTAARPLTIAVVIVLAAVNVSPGWTVRPQIFSYAAFAVLIVLLDAGFGGAAADADDNRAGSIAALCALPLLFVAWVNFHAGFVAGLVVLALYVASDAVERALRREPGWGARALRGLGLTLACGLAVLATPYGLAFPPWLLRAALLPRPAISEWQPLTTSDPQFVPFTLLVAVMAVAWYRSRRSRPLAHTVVALAVAWASWRHARHAPFLAILGALWIPADLDGARPIRADAESSKPAPRAVRIACWCACAVLALGLVTRIRPPWVHLASYPVRAFAFMQRHALTGRLMAQFDWAQYAIYAFAPASSVAFDGRFETAYPQTIADMHFDFLLGDVPGRPVTGDPGRMVELGAPDLVLVNRSYPNAVATIARADAWVLLYRDGLSELWGRAARYDDPTRPTYLPASDRDVSDAPQIGRVPWPSLP